MVDECIASGTLSAVVISAGFSEAGEASNRLVEQIRGSVEASGMAFISQSGALCSAVLDWSVKEHVGFSYFVSVGEMAGIGFHDLIDYFGSDQDTKAILIYMETLTQARSFMSAARSFACTKPIIVLKVGRSQEGAKAALYHTGSIT